MAKVKDFRVQRNNANRHTARGYGELEKSIEQDGWIGAMTVAADGETFDGSARLEKSVEVFGVDAEPIIVHTTGDRPVIVVRDDIPNTDDVRAQRLSLRANRIAELDLSWSVEVLAGLDADVLAGLWTGEELSDLGQQWADEQAQDSQSHTAPEVDRAEELREKWQTQQGQLWQLGPHRLICGDCTDAATVDRALDGVRINLAFTSPPYAEQRDYDAASGFKPIHPDEYVKWFGGVAKQVERNLAPDGSWFVNIKPAADGLDTLLYVFDLVIAHVREWGWHFVTEFCWERVGIPKQVKRRFKNQFEPVYQFARGDFKFRPDAVMHHSANVPRARGKGAGNTSWAKHQGGESIFMSGMQGTPAFQWFGDNVGAGMAYPGNRLPTFSETHEALGHAAAFPVGLPEFFVKAYTDASDVVYEPFAGSGSTLIAAHNQQRRCVAVELSPAYCAIILERVSALGIKPELTTDGRQ